MSNASADRTASADHAVPLDSVDAWWRAADYLSAAQLYLVDDVLLERPLEQGDVKRRLLGHWGTVPALNLIYAHANRVVIEQDLEAIFVCGPGHGGQAMISNGWLDGTLSELEPEIGRDADGIRRLCRRFSFPGGVASHAAPSTPGSINEGGELGYSLAHAVGAVLDDPDLLAICAIGDGEAETATLAASWQLPRLLDPQRDGRVLPVLNLNGWKIANPTLLSRIPEEELRALLIGGGWEPVFVDATADEPPSAVHPHLAAAMDAAVAHRPVRGERRPMIVLRTPKGWTGPKTVDGDPVEGTWRAHQIPLDDLHDDPGRRDQLEAWLRSYRPEELFDDHGAPTPLVDAGQPRPGRRMSGSPRANGGVRRPLAVPDPHFAAVRVSRRRDARASATATAGRWLAELITRNPQTFRLFGADEVESNKLEAVLEASPRQWGAEIAPIDENLAHHGRVIELLSENLLQGLAEGYALTGRHPLFTSYEAFIHIVDSMFNQYAKWIESARDVPWREPLPAFTYLLSSHVWRQDHNGFSHQDPGFLDVVADKRAELTRIYLPADANTLLAVLERALPDRDVVNLVVAGKHDEPAWLGLGEARRHLERGASAWSWAGADGGDADDDDPDVVLACAGDVPTIEAVAAAQLIREQTPWLSVRVVNVVDLMRLVPSGRHPHGMPEHDWQRLFPLDVPVVFAFHGYPALVHRLLHGRPQTERFHVHGFQEKGTTTTPFDMLMLNDLDRFTLAADAVRRGVGDVDRFDAESAVEVSTDIAADLADRAGTPEDGAGIRPREPRAGDAAIAEWMHRRRANRDHAYREGVDLPEIERWRFCVREP
ncbi:phosphoketolase family protein [Schumannella soli]|uniref:Phosphoketolase family protein n=1 Tax=Schumannella soli TaxID=2590779 RepID=A0A506Y8I0_9MICO|nr:phosphoketolase family protein [Schumannella soli]TPW77497.1 phosphoketolase family protein [Schumannella soli]